MNPHDPVQDAIRRESQQPTAPQVEWHHKSKNPPPGLVWATDGVLVWLIYTDGKIPDNAYLVRAWSTALIPAVPAPVTLPQG